jgi:UDP-sugar transporter A1/2/3
MPSGASGTENQSVGSSDTFLGLSAVFSACVLSGLAGVYFEKVLKNSSSGSASKSLWERNIQLSAFSILLSGIVMYSKDGHILSVTGVFYGFNYLTWVVISVQAFGGLLVAVVVKYADNILKGFATSISIILSFIASVFIFDFEISASFVCGCICVIGATLLYGKRSSVDSGAESETGIRNIKIIN